MAKPPIPAGPIWWVSLRSKPSLEAFNAAEYRLRHNARYAKWDDTRRLRYCLMAAYRAAQEHFRKHYSGKI